MSSTSLTNLGTQAIFAAYAQLQTTGNNIANANTPGYSRQSAELATVGSDYNGSGYMGRGVTVATVTRASNMFLTQQAVATASAAAADGVQRDMLSQLEKVFAGGASGLGQAATQVFNAYADLAAAPADLSARQAVLGRLSDFASLARSSSDQIETLQASLQQDVAGGITEVNTLATALAKLNTGIAAAVNRGHLPNELLDQRDQLIQRIGAQMQVHTFLAPDQTASVFVGTGQTLVLGASSNRLLTTRDPDDPSRVGVALSAGGQISRLSAADIGDGMVGGLLKFQATDLAEARNRLGQLVTGMAGALNRQQGFGLDLQGNVGAPVFAFSAPQVLPATGNARAPSGAYIATVSVAVADASQLKASDYRLEPDPASAGQYRVTRLSDGQTFQPVANGQVIDGFSITIGPNPPAAGDSFVLKTVGRAAADLSVVLRNPRGLAAAAPVTALAAAANTGTASVASLDIVAPPAITAPPAAAYAAFSLNFIDNIGGYQILDAGNSLLASGSLTAGQPIVYNGVSLSLAGVPRTLDRIDVAPTTQPAGNNGNALHIDGMAGSLLVDGQTVSDAYANAMSDVGVRMQGAVAAADTSSAVSGRAKAELTGKVGVNLDEEAARLLQFQQSYQAAAKMLQTAQTLFDSILSLAR
jgi:flagellar hook-associated protein 1 FlgK